MNAPASRPVYHVRHDLKPILTEEVLILLGDKAPCRVDVLERTAIQRGYYLAGRSLDQLLASLGALHLVERGQPGELQFTGLGRLMAQTAKHSPHLLPELVHFTYYALYDEQTQAPRFSWSYRVVCDYLWNRQRCALEVHQIIAFVQESAQQTFSDYGQFGVSFSQDSVTGITQWFEALDPPTISRSDTGTRTFGRRLFAPPETVLLALERARLTLGNASSRQLQLSTSAQDLVARSCLLEPDIVLDMIEATAEAFGLAYRQTERGEWITLPGDRSPFPISLWFPASSQSGTPSN